MLNPLDSELSADPVVALYRQAELFMLGRVAESAGRVADAPDWQQSQLREVQRLRRDAESAAGMIQSRLPDVIAEAVEDAHSIGVAQAVDDIEGMSVSTTVTAGGTVEPQAITALAGGLSSDLAVLNRSVLRSSDDAWRRIVQNVTARTVTGAQDIQSAWRAASKQMAGEGLAGFVDRAGRRWQLDTYAEMATRTATNEALMAGHTSVMVANGFDLVRVSWHPNPAPMCAPYEGKVLSLSGSNVGTISVPSGVGSGDVTVDVVASMEEARANGFRHANCRHAWSAYVPGTALPDVPDDPDNEGYKATQQQRYYERQVRKWKRVEAGSFHEDDKRDARARVRGYQGRIRDVVEEHDLPRRRHREQLR